MNYIDYDKQLTRKGELMSTEKPLIDYANHNRRTDALPEKQDGAGAITWIAVAFILNVILCIVGVYFG